jgi:hypothetical protein
VGLSEEFIKAKQNDEAYVRGVEETSDIPLIYVDPKSYALGSDWGDRDRFIQQIESQVPGATQALLDRVSLAQEEDLNDLVSDWGEASPAALNGIVVGGQEYCIINKPSDEWDTKADIVSMSLDNADEMLGNVPGNDMDWNRAVGNHEGEHCNKTHDGYSEADTLNEEARADRSTIKNLIENDLSDVALAFKDLRHLGSVSGYDVEHATGILLGEDTVATDYHTGSAGNYKVVMDYAVDEYYDWSDFEAGDIDHSQSLSSPTRQDILLKENPDEYFSTVSFAMEEYRVEVLEAYKDDPSFSNAQDLMYLQTTENYIQNFEGAYRRRFLGEDTPEAKPVEYISPSEFEKLHLDSNFEHGDSLSGFEYEDGGIIDLNEITPTISMEGDLNKEDNFDHVAIDVRANPDKNYAQLDGQAIKL